MTDKCFRFSDQNEMIDVLSPLGMIDENGDGEQIVVSNPPYYASWVLGEIVGYSGWHLNIRQIDPNFDLSAIDPYQVYPQDPVCKWA
jgi:hypothetical protein